MGKTAVFIIRNDDFEGIEGETALRVMKRLFRDGDKPPDIFEVEGGSPLTIGDLRNYRGYNIFVFVHGILFITQEGVSVLSGIAKNCRQFSFIVPVSNESKIPLQRSAPPFLYQTVSVFKRAVSEIHKKFKDEIMEANKIDDFCLALRKDVLGDLPQNCSLTDFPQFVKKGGLRSGIAKGVYVHRYGNCYESSRDDLMEHVPLDSRDILDVGSARGLFGELLKKRQRCVVTGIDVDGEMIAVARNRLDNVIEGSIEEILERGTLGKYDCIICGDVLEHLNDPWKVVKGLKAHLRKKGLFIASTPNVMNWAIISDQLRGRWDYVPFSILSGTHIRFFTKETLKELFEGAGYKIREVKLQSFEIPPQADVFIGRLKSLFAGISVAELKASEIVLIAEG